MGTVVDFPALELNLAVVACRSYLVGALLRYAVPTHRHTLFIFLRGLSQSELECLADFQGAVIIESQLRPVSAYRLMEEFFHTSSASVWKSSDERAHKSFLVLTYLDHSHFATVGHHSPVLNAV